MKHLINNGNVAQYYIEGPWFLETKFINDIDAFIIKAESFVFNVSKEHRIAKMRKSDHYKDLPEVTVEQMINKEIGNLKFKSEIVAYFKNRSVYSAKTMSLLQIASAACNSYCRSLKIKLSCGDVCIELDIHETFLDNMLRIQGDPIDIIEIQKLTRELAELMDSHSQNIVIKWWYTKGPATAIVMIGVILLLFIIGIEFQSSVPPAMLLDRLERFANQGVSDDELGAALQSLIQYSTKIGWTNQTVSPPQYWEQLLAILLVLLVGLVIRPRSAIFFRHTNSLSRFGKLWYNFYCCVLPLTVFGILFKEFLTSSILR